MKDLDIYQKFAELHRLIAKRLAAQPLSLEETQIYNELADWYDVPAELLP